MVIMTAETILMKMNFTALTACVLQTASGNELVHPLNFFYIQSEIVIEEPSVKEYLHELFLCASCYLSL